MFQVNTPKKIQVREKDWSQQVENMQDKVSGGVSVPVSIQHPLQMPNGNLYSVMSNSARSTTRERDMK